MAHFAKLVNNIVKDVIVVDNASIDNLEFPYSEPVGQDFITSIGLEGSQWKQTSYNGNFRKRYAGIGYIYDADRDAFIPPKPYNSWVLDEQELVWGAPVAQPAAQEGQHYNWDEDAKEWVLYVPPPGTISIPAAEQQNGTGV